MVDALERTHRWLTADGFAIDLRPAETVPVIAVGFSTDEPQIVGVPSVGAARKDRHAAADRALDHVVSGGLFRVDASVVFTLFRYAASAAELQTYLATEWRETTVDDATRDYVEGVLAGRPGARLWLSEQVAIRRLHRLR